VQLEALTNENQLLNEQLENALSKVEMVCCVIFIFVLLHPDCYYFCHAIVQNLFLVLILLPM
jgi:hypothetical protein